MSAQKERDKGANQTLLTLFKKVPDTAAGKAAANATYLDHLIHRTGQDARGDVTGDEAEDDR